MIDGHQELFPRAEKSDLNLEPWEREVVGMLRAIEIVDKKARGDLIHGFTKDDVLAIHKAVLNDPFNPQFSGALREAAVKLGTIIQGKYHEASFNSPHPDELPVLFDEFSRNLKEKTLKIDNNTPLCEVVEIASWSHHALIRIHPFIDGNGRTARLLVDLIFKKANLPYIIDWGAKNDEYKKLVHNSFTRQDPDSFKAFLAEKLLISVNELENEGLVEEVSHLKRDITNYLSTLH